MSDSKIQIKVGIVEFSGEGDQAWLTSQLDKILIKIPELLKLDVTDQQDNSGKSNEIDLGKGKNNLLQLSMTNIAAKLSCKSGQDLTCAAAAYLKFVQGKNTFTRSEILTAMKTATGYFKSSYGANLTNILGGMLKTALNEPTKGNYSIQNTKEKELNAILFK